jgi:hypothetical protein
MPFAPFTPPTEPEHHHQLVVHQAPARGRSITWTSTPTQRTRRHLPRWVWWLVSLAVFIALWWVSLDFRGLVIVLAIFWFFAIGVHPVVHMGRTVHDIFDGED